MRRRLPLVALALCLGATPAAPQPARGAEFPPPSPDSLAVGPLLVRCRPENPGIALTCILSLSAALVGAHTLTATQPNHRFDVAVGNATANGTLSVTFLPAGQLSTAWASLRVVVAGQRPITYRGTFLYWQMARSPAAAAMEDAHSLPHGGRDLLPSGRAAGLDPPGGPGPRRDPRS